MARVGVGLQKRGSKPYHMDMSNATLSLMAEERHETGRHVRALRRTGKVPGIVYGHGKEPILVSVPSRELALVLRRAGATTLVELSVGSNKALPTLLREVQRDPRTQEFQHVDFFAVDLKEKVVVDVKLVLVGEAPAVADLKIGQLLQTMGTVRVECLPRDLPSQIGIDVTGLSAVDDAVTVGQLTLPSGVVLLHEDHDDIVVKVAGLRVATAADSAPVTPAVAASGEDANADD